tara:strand:+ start:4344 stop:4775 length:432 start_codon:yes stop_codon:yes gene_type:complete
MKNTNTPAAKYRPVLTAEQIEHILTLAKLESPMSSASISILGSLSPFFAKIQNKAVNAAYSTTEKSSKFSIESLGGSATGPDLAPNVGDKEEYWERCYNQWLIDPTSLSLNGIEAANEHRYLHGIMTPEEQASFETGTPMGEG